jgi:hypothetical protein
MPMTARTARMARMLALRTARAHILRRACVPGCTRAGAMSPLCQDCYFPLELTKLTKTFSNCTRDSEQFGVLHAVAILTFAGDEILLARDD